MSTLLTAAASGDLRNVFTSVASIPERYSNPLHIHINDRDFDIVARNAIILLISLTVPKTSEAVECMIHIWYSAQIRQSNLDIVRGSVRPLIEDVCKKIASKPAARVLGKTWTFQSSSLRLVLTKEQWVLLLEYFEVPRHLSSSAAQQIRTAVTMADTRRDFRERGMIPQVPAHRLCSNKFREDGILLPFGSHRNAFTAPNP